MSTPITGVVTNGVVIPNSPLPEGAQVEINFLTDRADSPSPAEYPSPAELRKMPREQRQAILAAAAAMAEQDYISDRNLTAFEAFSEEAVDDSDSR